MPGTSAFPKEARQAERRKGRNKSARSSIKTNVTRMIELIAADESEPAKKAAVAAIKALDKAAEKGIIHKNAAARRKSRLMKKLNMAQAKPAPAKSAPQPPPENPA